MSWQQRLSALASQQQHLVTALLAAVRIHHTATGARLAAQPTWPADGHDAAPAEVQRQLMTILSAYVVQALAQLQPQAGSEFEAAAAAAAWQQLAHTTISCCLLVRRPDALWSDFYPLFHSSKNPMAQGEAGAARPADPAAAFLRQLLPFILSDQLPSVAPEARCASACTSAAVACFWPLLITGCARRPQVMQALVEECVAAGLAVQLEACVLKMDLLSLDLNQVGHGDASAPASSMLAPANASDVSALPHMSQLIPLCIRHRLFAALIHIFARALQDYQTPAALLLVAAAAACQEDELAGATQPNDSPTAEKLLQQHEGLRLGFKLLVFLRCCLLERAYPPGVLCSCLQRSPGFFCAVAAMYAPQRLPCTCAAGMPQASPDEVHRSKAQALAFLLYSSSASGVPSCCVPRPHQTRQQHTNSLRMQCCSVGVLEAVGRNGAQPRLDCNEAAAQQHSGDREGVACRSGICPCLLLQSA